MAQQSRQPSPSRALQSRSGALIPQAVIRQLDGIRVGWLASGVKALPCGSIPIKSIKDIVAKAEKLALQENETAVFDVHSLASKVVVHFVQRTIHVMITFARCMRSKIRSVI